MNDVEYFRWVADVVCRIKKKPLNDDDIDFVSNNTAYLWDMISEREKMISESLKNIDKMIDETSSLRILHKEIIEEWNL